MHKKKNEQIFDGFPDKIVWYDKMGAYAKNNHIVTLVLWECSTKYKFDGYKVTITNKNTGLTLASHIFKFENHIEGWHHRDPNQEHFHLWENSGKLDWYNSYPTSYYDYQETIYSFINLHLC